MAISPSSIYSFIKKVAFVVIALVLLGTIFTQPKTTSASSTYGNIHGFAWSSTIGWLSLNCAEGGPSGNDICSASPYGVTATASTTHAPLSGYAWSDGLGWVSFNSVDTSVCGDAPDLQFSTHKITGWARVLSGSGSSGADGCIKMSDSAAPSYGVTYNPYEYSVSDPHNLTGYAWGSTSVGWLNFDALWQTDPVSATLTGVAAGTTLPPASSVTIDSDGYSTSHVNLAWTVASASSCTATGGTGTDGWTTVSFGTGAPVSGSITVDLSPNNTPAPIIYIYNISCASMDGTDPATSTVTVTLNGLSPDVIMTGQAAGGTPVSYPSTVNLNAGDSHSVTLAWSTPTETSCTTAVDSTVSPVPDMTDWSGYTGTLVSMPGTSAVVTVPNNTSADPQTYIYKLTCNNTPYGSMPITGEVDVVVAGDTGSTDSTGGVTGTLIPTMTGATVASSYPMVITAPSSLGGPVDIAWTVNTGTSGVTSCSTAVDGAASLVDTGWGGAVSVTSAPGSTFSGTRTVNIPANSTASDLNYIYKFDCIPTLPATTPLEMSVTVIIPVTSDDVALTVTAPSAAVPTNTLVLPMTGSSGVVLQWNVSGTMTSCSVGGTIGGTTAITAPAGWPGTLSSPTSGNSASFTVAPNTDPLNTREDTYSIQCVPADLSPVVSDYVTIKVAPDTVCASDPTCIPPGAIVDFKTQIPSIPYGPGGGPVTTTAAPARPSTMRWRTAMVTSCNASTFSSLTGLMTTGGWTPSTVIPSSSISSTTTIVSGFSPTGSVVIPANTAASSVLDRYIISCQFTTGTWTHRNIDIHRLGKKKKSCTSGTCVDPLLSDSNVSFFINGTDTASIDASASTGQNLSWVTHDIQAGSCVASSAYTSGTVGPGTDTDWNSGLSIPVSSTGTSASYSHIISPTSGHSEDFTLSGCKIVGATDPLDPITVHLLINAPTCTIQPLAPYLSGLSGGAISGTKNFGVVWAHTTWHNVTLAMGAAPAYISSSWVPGTGAGAMSSSPVLNSAADNRGISISGTFPPHPSTEGDVYHTIHITGSGTVGSDTITCTPADLYLVPFGVALPSVVVGSHTLTRPSWKEF